MVTLSLFPLPGIAYTHDASACLLSEQGVLFAYEEERLLRAQHAIGHVPERAALLGLKDCGIPSDEIDHIVVTSMEKCRQRSDFQKRLNFLLELLLIPKNAPVSCVPHHMAHSALAVLTSPFEDCAFVTLDGGGDGRMGLWGTYRHGRFHVAERLELSPAIFFSFVTGLCGFPLFEEGKVMGLAAYGRSNEKLYSWFTKHFWIRADSGALETDLHLEWTSTLDTKRVNADFFSRQKYYRLGVCFRGECDSSGIEELSLPDVARTGQKYFQELLRTVFQNVAERTGLSKIACSGGAFLNAAANGYLASNLPGIELYVPVAPHDAGLALGAGLFVHHKLRRPRPVYPMTPYLGPSFESKVVEDALHRAPFRYEKPTAFLQTAAEKIATGAILGWFCGRAEFGARALGARSVLADPRDRNAKARLNQLLKRRDWFMPFAPSILEEFAPEYFENYRPSPYMNSTLKVKESKVSAIAGAVHVDGTCRAHTVSRDSNPMYYDLIKAFFDLTGIPMVLNTSFNQHGLPMVATPRDAVQHLNEGGIDALAIEGFIAERHHGALFRGVQDEQSMADLATLEHAARLAVAGRLEAALAVLSNSQLNVVACEKRLAWEDGREWRYDEPLARLRDLVGN